MSYVEIEVRARTVDLAVEAAMQELGVTDREQLAVEVIQQPEKGFPGPRWSGCRGQGEAPEEPASSQ